LVIIISHTSPIIMKIKSTDTLCTEFRLSMGINEQTFPDGRL
jgi:hypothetical protein